MVSNSISKGETTYAVPLNLNMPDSYAFPDRQQQVRGYLVWNELEPDMAIQPPVKINSFKLKSDYPFERKIAKIKAKNWDDSLNYEVISIDDKGTRTVYIETLDEAYKRFEDFLYTKPEFKNLKDNYPDKYNVIMRVVYNKGVKELPKIHFEDKGFSTIAIPKDLDNIPEYLIPFIDQTEMVKLNTAAGNILLGSLGIYCDGANNKTNILKL